MNWPKIIASIVRVDGGRGFVVQGRRDRLIITAGHCLPHLPPSMTFSHTEERTYGRLVGPLGAEPSIAVEVLFVDPVADLAVLGPPDSEELPDEHNLYEAFVEERRPLKIGKIKLTREKFTDPPLKMGEMTLTRFLGPPSAKLDAWVISLANEPVRCRVVASAVALSFRWDDPDPTVGGMSGSPILDDNGKAIGVVVTGTNSHQPFLDRQLPRWLLDEFRA